MPLPVVEERRAKAGFDTGNGFVYSAARDAIERLLQEHAKPLFQSPGRVVELGRPVKQGGETNFETYAFEQGRVLANTGVVEGSERIGRSGFFECGHYLPGVALAAELGNEPAARLERLEHGANHGAGVGYPVKGRIRKGGVEWVGSNEGTGVGQLKL